jgi:hypothetical protein
MRAAKQVAARLAFNAVFAVSQGHDFSRAANDASTSMGFGP